MSSTWSCINYTLIHFSGKKGLVWGCILSFFQHTIITHSIQVRFCELEASLHHGTFLAMTFLDHMSFSASLSWDLIQAVCIQSSSISWSKLNFWSTTYNDVENGSFLLFVQKNGWIRKSDMFSNRQLQINLVLFH